MKMDTSTNGSCYNTTTNNKLPDSSFESSGIMKNYQNSKIQNDRIWTKCSILLNMACLLLIWFGNFTAFLTLEVLQTSINNEIGIYSITLSHVAKLICSFFGPVIVYKLTPKWAVMVMTSCILIFVISNFYPKSYILIPAGILIGLSQGPGWVSFGIYGTVMGVKYAEITKQPKDRVLSRFNGFMTAAIPLAIATGNFLSSFILNNLKFGSDNHDANANHTIMDITTISLLSNRSNFEKIDGCGPNYCPENNEGSGNSTANEPNGIPDMRVFYVLLGVLGCFAVFSLILSIFGLRNLAPTDYKLQKIDLDIGKERKRTNYLKSFFDWRFILLGPVMAYIFLFLSYIVSMFPRAYVTCTIGVQMIGYLGMVRGISDFLTSNFLGIFGHLCNRYVWLAIGFAFAVANTVTLLFLWDVLPDEESIVITLLAVSIVSGMITSINISQFSAFLGSVFTEKKTEAFSFFHFVGSIFGGLGFYSNIYLCVIVQLYILLVTIFLAGTAFTVFAVYSRKKTSETEEVIPMQVKQDVEQELLFKTNT